MGNHAKYAPSSAFRWTKCPGSIVYESALPDYETSYTRAGTFEHDLSEHCILKRKHPKKYLNKKFQGEKVTAEIVDRVGVYYEYIRKKTNGFEIRPRAEQRVKLTAHIWGTVDCYFVKNGVLYVVDYKSGFVKVDPEKNLQLIIYALGALKKVKKPIKKCVLVIVQPKDDFEVIKKWVVSVETLKKYKTKIIKSTKRDKNNLMAGSWCRWCKAAPICPERFVQLDWLDRFDLDTTPLNELRRIYLNKAVIVDYLNQIEKFFLRLADNGKKIGGLKMVAKRAFTYWRFDADTTARRLRKAGFTKKEIEHFFYKRTPKTPNQVKETIGPKLFEKLTVKRSSGNKIVGEDERGAPVDPLLEKFKDD